MTILYIISATKMGGATMSFLTLVEGVMKRGDRPIVIIPNNNNPSFIVRLQRLNVLYYVVPLCFSSYPSYKTWQRMVKFPCAFLKQVIIRIIAKNTIIKIIKTIKPDIVHTNVGPLHVGHFAAKACSVPHVWHLREYQDLDFDIHAYPSVRAFCKFLREDYIITITKDIQHYFGLDDYPKCRTIYNGVRCREDIFYEPRKEKFFLCASRVSVEKGHECMIRAFAKFYQLHKDYKLIILGEGHPKYINNLKLIASKLGCDLAIVFEGFKENVTDYMKKAKALIVASPAEGFGRMTAEAGFAGCIVIGRNSGGTKEILDHTGGFFFNNDNELLAAMSHVADMSDLEYVDIALKAQRIAQDSYSEESYLQAVYDVYSLVLENHD